ncbi:MAG: pilus assembly protein TadG-related protein, partial [Thermomicrobiaceae bacterium]
MSSRKTPPTIPVNEPGRWRSKEGQILVMFAAGLMLLLGMIALSVDGGFIMAEKRQVQSAADAGALAAAKAKLDYKYQPAAGNLEAVQIEAGKNYGAENADTSQDNVIVDTSPDPLGEDYVEVTVSKDVESFFLRALYDGEWGVSATAIAGMEPVQLPYALVALRECDPPNPTGIAVNGSGTIDVNEGSIMSNCNIERSGDSSIIAADGAIDANGTIDPGTQWDAGQGFREGRPQLVDPLATTAAPSRSTAQALREITTQSQLVGAVPGSS